MWQTPLNEFGSDKVIGTIYLTLWAVCNGHCLLSSKATRYLNKKARNLPPLLELLHESIIRFTFLTIWDPFWSFARTCSLVFLLSLKITLGIIIVSPYIIFFFLTFVKLDIEFICIFISGL